MFRLSKYKRPGLSHHFRIPITPYQLFHRHQWTASFLSFLGEYKGSVFQQNIRKNAPLSSRKLVTKSPSFQFLRHVGQKSLERTLRQICRSIVLDKISCFRTCWWHKLPQLSCRFHLQERDVEKEDKKECGFLYQVFYFCNPPCFKSAGKAAETIARRSKSSRQLKQKFSHT